MRERIYIMPFEIRQMFRGGYFTIKLRIRPGT